MKLTNEQVRLIVKECKLVHNGELNPKWIFNFAMGLHSKIPICCVVFYCNTWDNLNPNLWEDINDYRPAPNDIQYIRCPECCKRDNRAKIHRCKPNQRECFIDQFGKLLRSNEKWVPNLIREKWHSC